MDVALEKMDADRSSSGSREKIFLGYESAKMLANCDGALALGEVG